MCLILAIIRKISVYAQHRMFMIVQEDDIESFLVPFQGREKLVEMLDLTVTDLLVLYYLLRYVRPVVRFTLLQDINSCLGPMGKISPSRLYSSLQRLEKKELVTFIEGHGKSTSKDILATVKAQKAISEVLQFSLISIINFFDLTSKLVPEVRKRLEQINFDSLLLVNLERDIDIRILEVIEQNAGSVYLLATDEEYNNSIARGMNSKIAHCLRQGSKILVKNNTFENIVVMGTSFHAIDSGPLQNFFSELKRVLKPHGTFIFTSTKPLPDDQHFIIESMRQFLSNSPYTKMISENNLKEFLKSLNLQDIDILDFKGLLVGWGRKNSS